MSPPLRWEPTTGTVSPTAEHLFDIQNGAIAGPGLLLGADTDNPDLDISFNQSLWPEWPEQRWLPVATDGVGNAYVVTSDEDPGSLAYVGASSLVHFLVFLLDKELGERRWPFDADYVTEQDPAITSAPGAPLPWAA